MNTNTTPAASPIKTVAENLILDVHRVTRDGGDYCVKCPHCKRIIGIEGNDLSEIRGEQYQDTIHEYQGAHGTRTVGCGGWLQVSTRAVYVKEL